MSTSGSTDYNLIAADVVRFALRKIRVIGRSESASAGDMEIGLQNLNLMLKTWQMSGPHLFRQTQGSLTPIANTASYALTTTRPYRIISARFKQSGREMPMEALTREEYFDLPLKTSTGIPTAYYFDPQRAAGTLYIWPVLGAVDTETIEYTYQRRIEDVDAKENDIDVPQEWMETVGYALAARLLFDFGKSDRDLVAVSAMLVQQAKMADCEPVVRFEPA